MLLKKLIFFIIFIILSSNLIYSLNQSPENVYTGYGYVAGVNNIMATVVNPANLYVLNNDEMYVSFNKPLQFHSLAFGFPISTKYYLGVAIIDNPDFRQYRLGMNIFNRSWIKFGIATGVDQERINNDKIGFCLSPGLTVLLFRKEDINFGLSFGLNFKNLISINHFESSTNYTRHNIDLGLRSEIFLRDLFLNLGANYYSKKFNFSPSLEYLITDFINLGIVYQNTKNFGCGFTLNFLNNYVGFAYLNKTYSISYSLSLNDAVDIQSKSKRGKSYRGIRAVRTKDLNQQKKLLEEGIALYKEKKYEEARDLWRKAIRLAPRTEYAKEAQNYINKVNNILKSVGE